MSSSKEQRVHEGKLAIITGSARNIGAAIARNLASKGANIVINYATTASDDRAGQLARSLEDKYAVKAITVRADVSKREDCTRLVEEARKFFAKGSDGQFQIDILVHNAAIALVGTLDMVTEPDFERIYATNVLGPALLTAACQPHLPTDRSGRIVVMSSIGPKVGVPTTTLYSGTKGALEAMARVWARELAERATVNIVSPGAVMTDMFMGASDEYKSGVSLWNPVTPLAPVRPGVDPPEVCEIGEKYGGRPAYDDDVAGVVASVCGPEFGWCTGSLISASGGLSFSV